MEGQEGWAGNYRRKGKKRKEKGSFIFSPFN